MAEGWAMGWGRLLWLAGMLAGGAAGDLPADPGRFGRWFAAGVEGTLDVPSPIARRAWAKTVGSWWRTC